MTIEIASAQLQRPDKGEDSLVSRQVAKRRLIVVADGLTLGDGAAASSWIKQHFERERPGTSRQLYARFVRGLASAPSVESESTVTGGVLTEVGAGAARHLHFEFFAIGDSPIWKVVRADGRYGYQRQLVHGAPYPAEQGRVYGTVRLDTRTIHGGVTFGSIDVGSGEVLVVCSDGIPERDVFVRDLALCEWMFGQDDLTDDGLAAVLRGYDDTGVLSDDATIVAARLGKRAVRK